MKAANDMQRWIGRIADYLRKGEIGTELRSMKGERPFRTWVGERIREYTAAHDPGLSVFIEPSEGGVTPVRAFGTTFWPDVSIQSGTHLSAAVEVKCLQRRGLPGHIAQALGQALLYKSAYDGAFVVYVVLEPLGREVVSAIEAKLAEFDIESVFVYCFDPIAAAKGMFKGTGPSSEDLLAERAADLQMDEEMARTYTTALDPDEGAEG